MRKNKRLDFFVNLPDVLDLTVEDAHLISAYLFDSGKFDLSKNDKFDLLYLFCADSNKPLYDILKKLDIYRISIYLVSDGVYYIDVLQRHRGRYSPIGKNLF